MVFQVKTTMLNADQVIQLIQELHDKQPLKSRLCAALRRAYDETSFGQLVVEIGGLEPEHAPLDSAQIPLDLPESEEPQYFEEHPIRVIVAPNLHKQELLEEAVALGCEWAIEQQRLNTNP